jgi:prepilin-type N-terminal cleavage/methylation domain-containing protein
MKDIFHKKTKASMSDTLSRGFTLIEVMIAMAIFTILITIGIGSVLNAMQQHKSTENLRSVLDTLNFVMEDMTHNLRLATNVHCLASGEVMSFSSDTDPVTPQNCPFSSSIAHNSIVFNDQNGNLVTYLISSGVGGLPSKILKQKGFDPSNLQVISPDEVSMDFAQSGFTVYGAEPTTAGDVSQPVVIIRLVGSVTYKNTVSNFAIESTVTLRALDS